jgi:hypothetical protein
MVRLAPGDGKRGDGMPRSDPDRREIVISVRLSSEEESALRRESEKQGVPMSTLARMAIARQYGGAKPQPLAGPSTRTTNATGESAKGRHRIQQGATNGLEFTFVEPVPAD